VQTCLVAPGPLEPTVRALTRQEEGRPTSGRSCTAVDRDHAERELERFAQSWDEHHPLISASLDREQIRKIIKTRGSFPNEDSARKLLYLAITRAQSKGRHTYKLELGARRLPKFTSATGSPTAHSDSHTFTHRKPPI
jgi:hypothetical protein